MSRALCFALCCVMCLPTRPAEARDAAGPALPQAHPPLSASVQSASEASRQSTDAPAVQGPGAELPPGHPVIDGMGGPAKDLDGVRIDPALPGGTVIVEAVDAHGQGMPGLRVGLEVVRESVADGKSAKRRVEATGPDGCASFTSVARESMQGLRVRIDHDSAVFASTPFVLDRDSGTRVRLHVYPVTRDIGMAQVASMARVYVQPQEEALLVEAMFSIANVGAVAWLPSVSFRLPREAQAFVGRDTGDTLTVVREQNSGRLEGTVGPGVHSVVFSFRVPRHGGSAQEVQVGVPPRLVQAEIMAEIAPRMTLAVRGFPAPTARRNEDGRRVLATGARIASSAESLAQQLVIVVDGLPTPGPGRWVALVLSFGLFAGGLVARSRGNRAVVQGLCGAEVEAGRVLMLDEVVALERARNEGRIGPRTYERARRELVDALARLEAIGR